MENINFDRGELDKLATLIEEYYKNCSHKNISSQINWLETYNSLPKEAPIKGESFQNIIDDLEKIILKGNLNWQSPNFLGYFPCTTSTPSVYGEFIAASLDSQGMMWHTSPSLTELEMITCDWLVKAMDLPDHFLSHGEGGGSIQDSASSSVLCAMIAARDLATNYNSKKKGLFQLPRLKGYCSDQAHFSVLKAASVCGIGLDNLKSIPSNSTNLAMDTSLLKANILEDIKNGYKPFFVTATIGTTSTLAIDDLSEIAKICKKHDIWLHVDSAFLGPLLLIEKFRPLFSGMENVDSFCFNAHKWMQVNFDCSLLYVKNRTYLNSSLRAESDYLKSNDPGNHQNTPINYKDWQIPLGKRFRALKLWMVIRSLGLEGIKKHLTECMETKKLFDEWLSKQKDFEILYPNQINLTCIVHKKGNEITKAILDDINKRKILFLSATTIKDKFIIRVCFGTIKNRNEAIEKITNEFSQTIKNLLG